MTKLFKLRQAFFSELLNCMCDVGSVLWIVRQKTPGKFIIISLYDLYPCNARNNNDGVLFYFPISVMKWLLAFFSVCLFVSGRY